ncbi:unnamed protein product, partial [Urochloa humidicola]
PRASTLSRHPPRRRCLIHLSALPDPGHIQVERRAPPTETRPAEGAEALANGAREPEEPAPEVEEEEAEEEPPRSATAKQEEAKAALGAEGSRPFTMQELLGELKEDGEAVGSGGSARSAFGDGNGIGSADAEGSSYRFCNWLFRFGPGRDLPAIREKSTVSISTNLYQRSTVRHREVMGGPPHSPTGLKF